MAQDAPNIDVPLIDLSPFGVGGGNETELENQQKVALELRNACEKVGFFYIIGHGCPPSVMDTMMGYTKRFFDLPQDTKNGLEARNNPLYRGYNSIETGAHSCTPEDATEHPPDLKESFTIGAETLMTSAAATSPMHGPNQWPIEMRLSSVQGFETAVRQYWDQMSHTVGIRLMQALAMSLELPIDFFTSKAQRNPHSQMVLLRYPPAPKEAMSIDDPVSGRRGCGAHTDCGFLTILMQDSEGLEVQKTDGTWVSAPPLLNEGNEHALVVNLGDMMAHWTNDRYQSTRHRVTNPSFTKTRHSIPFFLAVDYDTTVETIPSCHYHRKGQVYEPCLSGEYILQKLGLMHLAKAGTARLTQS